MSKIKFSEEQFVAALQELSDNDKKALQPRGGIGMQLERVLNKVLQVMDAGKYEREFTNAKGELETIEQTYFSYCDSNTSDDQVARIVLAYDLKSLYVGDSTVSLHEQVSLDKELLQKLIAFKATKVTGTGEFPMKLSKAAQDLGLAPLNEEMTPEKWKTLRNAYYRGAMDAKELRSDVEAKNYVWQEIKRVTIEFVEV